MKKGLTLCVLLVCLQTVQAQTWSEWFKQKKTQIKYLTQQIIALQVYIGFVEKGYEIAKDGLNVITDIKNGDFNIHHQYFRSLRTININVKDKDKLNGIFRLHSQIETECDNIRQLLKKDHGLQEPEIVQVKKVITHLSDLADEDLDHLQALVENDVLEMTDDQRWKRIDLVMEEMKDKYSFIRHFGNEVRTLSVQRKREQVEAERVKALYGQ